MTSLRLSLAASLVAAGLVVVACSAEVPVTSTPEEAFCDAISGTSGTCQGGCEDVLRTDCAKVATSLQPAALRKATDCFLSGACASVCLSKTLVDLSPSEGHGKVRDQYCGTCAQGQAGCATAFYAPQTPSSQGGAGTPILPFSDDAIRNVAADCAASEGCQLGFSSCSLESAKRAMAGTMSSGSAECLVRGLRSDEGEKRSPDGGAIVVTCTKQNCAGCCRDDLCIAGTAKDACGKGGASCETCSGTATCEASACKVPCSPETCAGCCENNECKDGTAKDACGKSGAACTKCGTAFVCSEQSCVDTSCKATCLGCCSGSTCLGGTTTNACGKGGSSCTSCGAGRTCGATGCTLDVNAPFDVILASASIPQLNKSGGSWDFNGGLPDPYAKGYSSLGTSSHSGLTPFISDTTFPQWNAAVLTQVPARELLSSFSVELWDDDYDFDDVIGGCPVRLDASMFDGSLKSAKCAASPSGVEVTVYFRLVAK